MASMAPKLHTALVTLLSKADMRSSDGLTSVELEAHYAEWFILLLPWTSCRWTEGCLQDDHLISPPCTPMTRLCWSQLSWEALECHAANHIRAHSNHPAAAKLGARASSSSSFPSQVTLTISRPSTCLDTTIPWHTCSQILVSSPLYQF